MSLVPIETARSHLRVEPDYPAEQIQPYLDAATDSALQFINRAVYATDDELQAAKLAVPSDLQQAATQRNAALAAAEQVADCEARAWLVAQAGADYAAALKRAREIGLGIPINASITAAILLTLGHLDENREEVARGISVTQLPIGAQHLLWPYRAGLGV